VTSTRIEAQRSCHPRNQRAKYRAADSRHEDGRKPSPPPSIDLSAPRAAVVGTITLVSRSGVLTVASAFDLSGDAPPAILPVPLRDTRNCPL